MHREGLLKAIKHFGSQQALAKAAGVSQQAVSHWLNREDRIHTFAALTIFVKTHGAIPLDQLVRNASEVEKFLASVELFLKFPAPLISIKDIHHAHMTCPIYQRMHYAAVINNEDLTRPILIDTDNQLITCSCRVQANLFWGNKVIHAHKINLSELLAGHISINSLLKLLPISERVAVGLAIEAKLGNRRGRRTDLQLPDIYPEVTAHLESRQIAAHLAGFSSEFIYRQAKLVIKNGLPVLVQLMDQEKITVSHAKKIASLASKQQLKKLKTIIDEKEVVYGKN